jgi:hypothetical protein
LNAFFRGYYEPMHDEDSTSMAEDNNINHTAYAGKGTGGVEIYQYLTMQMTNNIDGIPQPKATLR